jgi:RHS repeat-associated protein
LEASTTLTPTTIEAFTYTYDKGGNRITQLRQNAAASNLPTAVAATNIAYDATNELIRWNSATTNLTYDNNGNLVIETQAGVTTTYTWDGRNRLTGVSKTGLTASFVYDGLGRRKSKTINGATTGFWYDANDVYAELNGATPSANYIRGLSIDEPYIRKGASDEFYEIDALGTSVALTNGAGVSQTTYTYEPFGNTMQAGSVSGNAFQYTGRENDGTGLYYYRARYYYPKIQRFMNEDPIAFAGGDVNIYAYVGNNPISALDPLGLYSWDEFVSDLPTPSQGFVDFSGGLGDALLLGFGDELRALTPATNTVNPCSDAYSYGNYTALAAGGSRLAYAGLAKGISLIPRVSGAQASGARNMLKRIFRGGTFPNTRMPTYAELLEQKGTDAAVKAAAGRTDRGFNLVGAGVAGGALLNSPKCGCK